MKKILLTTILFTTITLSADINKELKTEAKQAFMKMGKTLQANMKKNMKEGGAIQASHFCTQEATNIENEVNKHYKKNIKVKRVSLKYRNQKNTPTADEAKVLQEIQSKVNNHQKVPKMIIKKISKNSYKVYKPIFIKKKVCLVCHGTEQAIDKNAYKIIKEKYPKDMAIDYKDGDFRGAFIAEIVK